MKGGLVEPGTERDARGRFLSNGQGPASGRPASGLPARGASWATFQKGNEAAVRHGGYAARVSREALERVEAILSLASEPGSTWSYLAQAGYRDALVAYAKATLVVEHFEADIAANGMFDRESGDPRASEAGLAIAREAGETKRSHWSIF